MTNIFDKEGNILPNIDVDSITEIEIPDWMTEVPDLVVFKNLMSVVIPDSITEIKDNAFANCKNLSHIKLPRNLISIGEMAFYRCVALTKIEMPDSVTVIEPFAFQDCKSLSHIKLAKNIVSIGEEAFAFCESLAEIEIPDNVTNIKMGTFRDCESLSHIKLSKNLVSIGMSAFSFTGLTEVEIPDSVTKIKKRAFSYCENLSHIKLPKKLTSIEVEAFSGCEALTDLEIPDSVTEIKDNAFDGCTSLSHIKLSNNVSSIGYEAFRGCEALTEIEIPETIQHIEEGAFSGCTNLQSVTIFGSETEVDKNAFDCCEEVLTIPLESHINPNAFGGSRPKELHVIGKVANPQVIENLYQALNLNGIRFFAPWNGETHFCGHTFTSEHGWMFDEKEQITFMLLTDHDGEYGDWDLVEEQLKMPNMPELYYGIFKDACPSVISLYQDDTLILPPNLIIIKQRIFDEEYIYLPRIILPRELKVIESFAFYHTGLKDITIPSSTWLIDNGALCTCEHTLESIRFEGKVNNIAAESISENGELPEGLKTIIVPKGLKGYYAEKLSGCKGIEDIIVEE